MDDNVIADVQGSRYACNYLANGVLKHLCGRRYAEIQACVAPQSDVARKCRDVPGLWFQFELVISLV